ncbi:MAG TPA: helix-turn-helix domain-containing protein [Conexibacter sp.]|nr:helix-turn-helix domain-containing protein [Conexibacter sp.]
MAADDASVFDPRPWHRLPAGAAAALRPALDDLAQEIIAAIRVEVPAYARPLEGPFGRGLVVGVEEALRQFLDGIEAGGRMPRSRVYVDLGRGEVRAGRGLDVLLAAYRVGARVAWRRLSSTGVAAGLEPTTLYLLAESIFAYIDELSAKSAEGYALEQSAAAGERRAQRQRLARLLVREPPADPLDVQEVARAADWRLPRTLAAFAFPEPESERIVPRLPADAIVETVGGVVCALVPDPDRPGRRAQLTHAVGRAGGSGLAALGPAVAWGDAALSLARARAVLELAAEGAAPDHGVLDARDHATALLLRSDRRLAQELVRDRLVPLQELGAGPRRRLTETLCAWLAAQGRLQAVAERLHVHPQTVRYRLAQLRELFGDALDDPQRRFELELALRAEGVFDGAAG